MRLKASEPTRGPRLYSEGWGSVPSVSAVLQLIEKSYLDRWRSRVGREESDRVLKNAQAFGTRLHVAAQQIAWGESAAVEPEIRPYGAAIQDFLNCHVREILGTEVKLVSKRLGFGGTADLYCVLKNGTRALIDWKSTTQLTRTHGHQLAAYALLAQAHGMNVNHRIGVRIWKDEPGRYSVRGYKDHAGDVKVFLSLVELWHALDRQKKDPLCNWAPPGT